MGGKGADIRHHRIAIQAYKLKQQGLTAREIAAHIGREIKQIPKLILLGERLLSISKI